MNQFNPIRIIFLLSGLRKSRQKDNFSHRVNEKHQLSYNNIVEIPGTT